MSIVHRAPFDAPQIEVPASKYFEVISSFIHNVNFHMFRQQMASRTLEVEHWKGLSGLSYSRARDEEPFALDSQSPEIMPEAFPREAS